MSEKTQTKHLTPEAEVDVQNSLWDDDAMRRWAKWGAGALLVAMLVCLGMFCNSTQTMQGQSDSSGIYASLSKATGDARTFLAKQPEWKLAQDCAVAQNLNKPNAEAEKARAEADKAVLEGAAAILKLYPKESDITIMLPGLQVVKGTDKTRPGHILISVTGPRAPHQ